MKMFNKMILILSLAFVGCSGRPMMMNRDSGIPEDSTIIPDSGPADPTFQIHALDGTPCFNDDDGRFLIFLSGGFDPHYPVTGAIFVVCDSPTQDVATCNQLFSVTNPDGIGWDLNPPAGDRHVGYLSFRDNGTMIFKGTVVDTSNPDHSVCMRHVELLPR